MPESKNGKIDIDRYRVKEGEKISLKDFPTACDVKIEKAEVKERYFPETIEKLKVLQEKLYAQNTYGLIIVLQAMDAAGKDGTESCLCEPQSGRREGRLLQTADK